MTKQEYNELLQRFHNANKWFAEEEDIEMQEKHFESFLNLVEQLRLGADELNPSNYEMLNGFNIDK